MKLGETGNTEQRHIAIDFIQQQLERRPADGRTGERSCVSLSVLSSKIADEGLDLQLPLERIEWELKLPAFVADRRGRVAPSW